MQSLPGLSDPTPSFTENEEVPIPLSRLQVLSCLVLFGEGFGDTDIMMTGFEWCVPVSSLTPLSLAKLGMLALVLAVSEG